MRKYFFAYLLWILAACGQSKNNEDKTKLDSTIAGAKVNSIQRKQRNSQGYSPIFTNAHPNAKLLMTDSFYFNLVDETAPFGNNDGADSYTGFKDWRLTHSTKDPKEFLFEQIDYLGYPKFNINETNFLTLKTYLEERELGSRFMSGIDASIIAIAFGQLYLEGTIEKDLKEIAKTAITRQLNPELLAVWGDPYKEQRKQMLKKMLVVLNKLI